MSIATTAQTPSENGNGTILQSTASVTVATQCETSWFRLQTVNSRFCLCTAKKPMHNYWQHSLQAVSVHIISLSIFTTDQPHGRVVRVSDYWSWGPRFNSRFYHGDFSLKRKIPMVTMVWVVQQNLCLRPLLVLHIHISPSTSYPYITIHFISIYHHPPPRDNVTAPHERPNLRSRLHFGHNWEGCPQSP
jgi:hypothetical protein